MLPPLPLPGAGPDSEPQIDVSKTKMGLTGVSQVSKLPHAGRSL